MFVTWSLSEEANFSKIYVLWKLVSYFVSILNFEYFFPQWNIVDQNIEINYLCHTKKLTLSNESSRTNITQFHYFEPVVSLKFY